MQLHYAQCTAGLPLNIGLITGINC